MTPERLAQLKHTIQMALLDWRLAHDEDDGEPCDLLDANWELVQAMEAAHVLIARVEACLPATDAGMQCPTCLSREYLDEVDICDRCDVSAVFVVRRRMTIEQFIANASRSLTVLPGGAV